MPDTMNQSLSEALFDSWNRNNTILINLLAALPESALDLRALPDSPTVAELFTHIHYVRLVFIAEDAPEYAVPVPDREWVAEHDRSRIAQSLNESALAVSTAVRGRLESGKPMDLHYDHPILLLQHMIWHEGYHHGQIKLALKGAGIAIDDEQIGPLTWGIWMDKN